MSELLTDLSDGTLTLTLNRPARRNATSKATHREGHAGRGAAQAA